MLVVFIRERNCVVEMELGLSVFCPGISMYGIFPLI